MTSRAEPRIIIVGPARHGKDTLAELLRDRYGWTFASSSHWVAKHFGREYLAEHYGLEYDTLQACLDDRIHHRDKWYKACRDYNKGDLGRLTNDILAEYNIYVGMRGRDELKAVEDSVDLVIWIEAPNRIGGNPDARQIKTNNLIRREDADIIIENDGTILDLITQLPHIKELVTWN
jgi:hypothetical protein